MKYGNIFCNFYWSFIDVEIVPNDVEWLMRCQPKLFALNWNWRLFLASIPQKANCQRQQINLRFQKIFHSQIHRRGWRRRMLFLLMAKGQCLEYMEKYALWSMCRPTFLHIFFRKIGVDMWNEPSPPSSDEIRSSHFPFGIRYSFLLSLHLTSKKPPTHHWLAIFTVGQI